MLVLLIKLYFRLKSPYLISKMSQRKELGSSAEQIELLPVNEDTIEILELRNEKLLTPNQR